MADELLTPERLAKIPSLVEARKRVLGFDAWQNIVARLADSVPALLAHIAAQDVRINELERRLDQAIEQDYCSICGGILNDYQGDEKAVRITALETALRPFAALRGRQFYEAITTEQIDAACAALNETTDSSSAP